MSVGQWGSWVDSSRCRQEPVGGWAQPRSQQEVGLLDSCYSQYTKPNLLHSATATAESG